MLVVDDICHQMHAQSEGADVKLLEVSTFLYLIVLSNLANIFSTVTVKTVDYSLGH